MTKYENFTFSFRCLTEYTHVILDEVHDREEDLDFVMLLCKKFVNTNSRGVKLILMSATLDIEKLKRYFFLELSHFVVYTIVKTKFVCLIFSVNVMSKRN